MRSDQAVHLFTTEWLWSHHWFYLNRFYVDGLALSDTEAGDCGEQNGKKKRNYGAEVCRLENKVTEIQGGYRRTLH